MTKIIAVCNQKGGVAKTTTVANLGAGLTERGKNVLLLDCDPQSNLTYNFLSPEALEAEGRRRGLETVYELLTESKLTIHMVTDALGLVPATIEFAGVEEPIRAKPGADLRLKRALAKNKAKLDAFDYILIDTPPTLGILPVNAMTAADSVLIPVAADGLSMVGLMQLLNTIEEVRDSLNPDLLIEGIVITRNKKSTNLSRDVIKRVEEDYPEHLFNTRVSEAVTLAEAIMHHKTIFEHDGGGIGAADYMNLVDEFLEREEAAQAEAMSTRKGGR